MPHCLLVSHKNYLFVVQTVCILCIHTTGILYTVCVCVSHHQAHYLASRRTDELPASLSQHYPHPTLPLPRNTLKIFFLSISLYLCFHLSSNHPGRERDKTMADKFMYIPNGDTQNYPFSRLQLVVETFVHSTSMKIYQSPRLLSKRIRKRYHKTLGTVINSPISPPSLLIISCVYYIYYYTCFVLKRQ